MQVNNDVRTEYLNNQGQVCAPKEGAAKIGNELNGSNSISKEEQRKKWILQDAQEFKVDYKDIINFVNKAFNISETEFYQLEDEQFELYQSILLCAFESANKKGKFDKQLFDDLACLYRAEKDSGRTDKEAQFLLDTFADNNTLEILKRYCPDINEYKSIEDIPQAKLSACFAKVLEKFKEAGISDAPKLLKSLLHRTSKDEEICAMYNAYEKVVSSNDKVAGLKIAIEKYKDAKKLQMFLRQFKPETIQAMGLDPKDITKYNYLLAKNLDEEGVAELQRLHLELAEKIQSKLSEIEGKNPEDYTDADIKVLEDLGYIKRASAGQIAGYQTNKSLSTNVKKQYSAEILEKSKELDIYEDVLADVVELTNDETGIVELSEEEKTQFNSNMNDLTNGDYDKAIETYNVEQAAKSQKTQDATSTDYGFLQRQDFPTIDALRQSAEEKSRAIADSDDLKTPNFELEKTPLQAEHQSYQNAKKNGIYAVIAFFKDTKNTLIKRDVAKTVAKDNNRVQLTNNGGNELAIYVNQARQFTTEELAKLKNISGIVKNAMKLNVHEMV